MTTSACIAELSAKELLEWAFGPDGLASQERMDDLDASLQRRLVDAMVRDLEHAHELGDVLADAWDRADVAGQERLATRLEAYLEVLRLAGARPSIARAVQTLSPTTVRADVLRCIVEQGAPRVRDVATALGKEDSAISRDATALEQAGLIRKQRVGREVFLHAREEGRQLVSQFASAQVPGPHGDLAGGQHAVSSLWSGLDEPVDMSPVT